MGNLGRVAIVAALIVAAAVVWAELSAPKDASSVSIGAMEKQSASASSDQARADTDPAKTANGAAPLARRSLYVDPALVEGTPQGFLPRIGPKGRKPSGACAAIAPNNKGPRLGLVIAGLGQQPALPATLDALACWRVKDNAGQTPIALAPASALLKQP